MPPPFSVTMRVGAPEPAARIRIARPDRRVLRAMPLTRRFDVACLDRTAADGVRSFTSIAPALPMFESAFAAVARATLIATQAGPVAVEDLRPADLVLTADNGPQPLLWIGAMAIMPRPLHQRDTMRGLIRVTADSFGLGRPMPDLMLGPGARLLQRVRGAPGPQIPVLSPITDHCDGDSVVRIAPPTAVTVYHLAFARHQIVSANGLEIESYHPGLRVDPGVGRDLLALFLALFPQIDRLDDFGPLAYPRLEKSGGPGA